MTRQGDRRRFAIVGVLAEEGPSTAISLCHALHRGPGTIYPDLVALEQQGRVVSYWAAGTGTGTGTRRRLWRLATDDERRDHQRRREQLEAAKRAPAKPPLRVVPKPCGGAA